MSDEMTHESGPSDLRRLFDVTRTNNEVKLTIRGSLDINSAPLLVEEVDRIAATTPFELEVDLSELNLIDSSGLAAVVKLGKAVLSNGGATVISGARGQPLKVFQLVGRTTDLVFYIGRSRRIRSASRPRDSVRPVLAPARFVRRPARDVSRPTSWLACFATGARRAGGRWALPAIAAAVIAVAVIAVLWRRA
jgi:anti-anti-sigma factor